MPPSSNMTQISWSIETFQNTALVWIIFHLFCRSIIWNTIKYYYSNMIFIPKNRIRKSYVLYPFKKFNLCIIWTVNRQNNLAIMHHATRKSVIDRVCIEKVQDSTLLSVGNILFAPQLMTVMVYQTEINLTSFSIR